MKEFLVVEAGERAPQRLRRKALDLTDDAIAGLDQIRGSDPAAIHAVRRRLKVLRALTRILGTSSEEGFFRDAGRELAAARDAKAALEAFDKLQKRFKDDWKPKQFQKIRRTLSERVGADVDAATIDRLRGALTVERGRIAAWTVDEMRRDDLWDAVSRSYRRARRGMRNAIEQRTPAAIHEWRKRVKKLRASRGASARRNRRGERNVGAGFSPPRRAKARLHIGASTRQRTLRSLEISHAAC